MHSLLTLILDTPTAGGFLVILIADVLGLLAIPSVLLRRAGQPVAALSWVLALIALPYIGVIAWWVLGRTHVERQSRKRRDAAKQFCETCVSTDESIPALNARLRDVVPFAVSGARWTQGVFPPAVVGQVSVLCDGGAAFKAMEAEIAAAEAEIRALFYVWQADATGRRLANQLAQKARSGIIVRILVDAVGGRPFLAAHAAELRAAGAEVASFGPLGFLQAPILNFRNHHKLLVVDGRVAFVGGMNIGDEYATDWHDLAFLLNGPVVQNLDEVFREDWFVTTGKNVAAMPRVACESGDARLGGTATVIASGPERDENRVHDAFFLAIVHAWQRVWIVTPYFIPSAAIMAALRSAAQRGVDVRIIVPRSNDVPLVGWASRSFFPEVMKAGAHVFEYQPRFSHAKAIVIDDDLTIIGSPNTDVRSFKLNFELACVIDSESLNNEVANVLLADLAQSIELRLEAFENRPIKDRLADSAAHLLSPLL